LIYQKEIAGLELTAVRTGHHLTRYVRAYNPAILSRAGSTGVNAP